MREDIGSYQLERVLGEGGMGVVYLAEHRVLKRRVAIKVLAPSASMGMSAALQRFLDEAQVTSAIEDPGIVQIFDFGYAADGRAYLVMEYLEGERLDQRVARTGPLPVAQALRIVRQLASSLRAAHARAILHRDLKPENILLVTDPAVPGGERTKLLDFGICKLMHRDVSVTSSGTIVGTPTYMSPEQCRGVRELDQRSDVYSLGCVLYFLLTGQPLFPYRSTGELLAAHLKEPVPAAVRLNAAVPAELDEMLQRCLAKDPGARIPSMAALIDELTELLAGTTGELPAEVATSSYLRAAPMNTTLTVVLAAAANQAQSGSQSAVKRTRATGARFPLGHRAALAAAAALALSAPASPPDLIPSDVIPATVRPAYQRADVLTGEPLALPAVTVPQVPLALPRHQAVIASAEPAGLDEAVPVTTPEPAQLPAAPAESVWTPPPPSVPIDGGLPVDAGPTPVDAAGDAAVLAQP
jgi:serine/threonine-protein kinase